METILPQGGADNLQDVSFIKNIKAVHGKLELAEGQAETSCENCSEERAVAYCHQCVQFICSECIKQHRRMKKTFLGHKVVTLQQLEQGGPKEIAMREPIFQACRLHEQPMNIYCFDCNSRVCCDCTIKTHLMHNYEFIKVAASKMRNHLIHQLGDLQESKMKANQAIEKVRTSVNEVETQGDSAAGHIESALRQLHKIIDARKQELISEAGVQVTQKLEHLICREKSLSTKYSVIQSVIRYTEQCIEHLDDDGIIIMYNEIQNRINKDVESTHEPEEDMDIAVEVSCVEELRQLCQTKISLAANGGECIRAPPEVYRNSMLPQSPTYGRLNEGVQSAEINKNASFCVSTNAHLPEGQARVRCKLKSIAEGSINYRCHVGRIHGGNYCIQYTPTVRGRHELTVTVNGQEITGSPFPVFVSIPPTQMGQPVRVIAGLSNPCSLDIFAGGEMIVAELNDFVIMSRMGKKLKLLKGAKLDMYHPCGVAVDNVSGCIFLAGKASTGTEGKIVKLSSDYRFLCEVKNRGRFWGFALVGREIMACDINNNHIVVYSAKDLTFVRQIGHHGSGPGQFCSVRDISSDRHGNLYVSSDSRIQVLSNSGHFIRAFDCYKIGLMIPRGVCVEGDYVYITDWDRHTITVFSTIGEFITSFGGRGSQEGKFDSPCGMCVDEDGFVYVCDYLQRRIQVM